MAQNENVDGGNYTKLQRQWRWMENSEKVAVTGHYYWGARNRISGLVWSVGHRQNKCHVQIVKWSFYVYNYGHGGRFL